MDHLEKLAAAGDPDAARALIRRHVRANELARARRRWRALDPMALAAWTTLWLAWGQLREQAAHDIKTQRLRASAAPSPSPASTAALTPVMTELLDCFGRCQIRVHALSRGEIDRARALLEHISSQEAELRRLVGATVEALDAAARSMLERLEATL